MVRYLWWRWSWGKVLFHVPWEGGLLEYSVSMTILVSTASLHSLLFLHLFNTAKIEGSDGKLRKEEIARKGMDILHDMNINFFSSYLFLNTCTVFV